jgi:hypothetical protein
MSFCTLRGIISCLVWGATGISRPLRIPNAASETYGKAHQSTAKALMRHFVAPYRSADVHAVVRLASLRRHKTSQQLEHMFVHRFETVKCP